MNIKRAKEEIKNTIRAYLARNSYGEYEIPVMGQRPVLLMGPPGIGKTQIMEQVARECGIGLVAYTITHHTRQSAIGLPFISEQTYGEKAVSVTQYTMSEIVAAIYNKMEETGLKEGILFIDEINCVSETLAPAMLQFLQYKTFGNHKIPDGWIIAAAGNPPEFNKSVREFDIATLDRVKRIDVEPDFSVWKEYAVRMEVHPAILSYLTARPQNFCQVETTVDGPVFATPRGWEDLSRFLTVYEKLGLSCDREVVAQYIPHGRIARDFASYLELYYKYQAHYQIDEALSGRRSEALLEQAARAPFDEKLSVISLVLAKLNVEFRKTGKMEDGLELLFEKLKDGGTLGQSVPNSWQRPGTGLLCRGSQPLPERSGRNMKGRNRRVFSQGPRSTGMRTSAGPWTSIFWRQERRKPRMERHCSGCWRPGSEKDGSSTRTSAGPSFRWWSTPSILWRAPLGTARKWSFSSQS